MLARTDPEFGVIEFVRSNKARNINVRILEDRLRVSLPPHATEKEAICFINSVREKITRKQNKVKESKQDNKIVLDPTHPLQTRTFQVQLMPSARENIFFSLKDGVLSIDYPAGADIRTKEIQHHLWNGINYFLKKEAKRLLPSRLKELAGKYGFSYSSVKIQSSKSRWGSCSQAGNINLSFYLMLLPQHLIDYVILHELCHTKEMNHSAGFWAWMDKVTDGKSKTLRAELKKYHIPG